MKRLVLASALTVLALSGFFGIQYYKRASDPLVAGIPPRENADGTVDYVLAYNLTAFSERLTGNYWVLRFKKNHFIRLSGMSEGANIGHVQGPAYTIGSLPNQYLVVMLREFGETEVMQNDPNVFKHYDGRVDIQAVSFLQSSDTWTIEKIQAAQERCAPPEVVSKRIVAYQEKTPPDRSYTNRCFVYYRTAEKSIGYIFYDSTDAPIAILSCGLPTTDELGICRGSIVSKQPGSVIVTIYFQNLEPQVLLNSVDKAIQYLSAATVARGQLVFGEKFEFR